MVNAKFPAPHRYGFEMVDAPEPGDFAGNGASMENLRRIKSRVFSTNFLRFKRIANTSNLVTAVRQEADCESNRNTV
jgi:hypothetical protein